MAAPSTKEKLHSLIDEMEIISKELFDLMSTPKGQRSTDCPADTSQLLELLVSKDAEVQTYLKTAEEQTETHKKAEGLKQEIDRRDADIRQLQKNLKEAEAILSTAIFQARQKLSSINRSETKSSSSEELIKYAHRISASNAVAAPPNWAQGDPRRPYPTDIEMRHGLLGRLSDLPINNQGVQAQSSFTDPVHADHPQLGAASSMSWQHSSHDLNSSIPTSSSGQMSVSMDTKGQNKENEDVEVMSTDSSSSSSSDE
ncbi:mediator of RNA polymerase II transcription subunit 4-like isoform X2 [Lineus longissimus]|uniref:mediator of RNA polymerase II transcription subunit 4-like isoform X2 n=1 Tax=Lineus longissimus TaxID=88925 RepID=UPI00315CF4B7